MMIRRRAHKGQGNPVADQARRPVRLRPGAPQPYAPVVDFRTAAQGLVAEWLADPERALDPLAAAVQLIREQGRYQAAFDNKGAAAMADAAAALFEAVQDELEATPVTYRTAARLSIWAEGTIKNRRSDLIQGAPVPQGTVPLAALPLRPGLAGLLAHRTASLTRRTEDARPHAEVEDSSGIEDGDDWASRIASQLEE